MRKSIALLFALALAGCDQSKRLQEERSKAAAIRAMDLANMEAEMRYDALALDNLLLEQDIARLEGHRFNRADKIAIARKLLASEKDGLDRCRRSDQLISNLENATGDDATQQDLPRLMREDFRKTMDIQEEGFAKMRARLK